MKNKKSLLSLLLFVLINTINLASAQTKIGITAGLNFSKMRIEDENGNTENTQAIPGIVIGLTVDIPVINDFFVQPAILYARKGFKQETGGFYGSTDNFKVKADYLEVPVNVLYKPQLGSGHLLLGAGPYIGYGTGGKWKSDDDAVFDDMVIGNKGDVIFRNDASEGGDMASYTYGRPFDYGANFLLGYEFLNHLSLQFNARVGLANLQPEFGGFQPEGKLKNSSLGISLGYKF